MPRAQGWGATVSGQYGGEYYCDRNAECEIVSCAEM